MFANPKNDLIPNFWKMGMNSFTKFMDKLISLNWKNIQLSRKPLDKRKQLETLSDQLIEQIDLGVREMEGLCNTLK